MIHRLKTDPIVFDAVARGLKTFELRKDDRDFQVGDTLLLMETQYSHLEMQNGAPLVLTGNVAGRDVKYILRGPIYGLAAGWVIMAFK